MGKVLGYGFKSPGETWAMALAVYRDGFSKSKKAVMKDIETARREGDISKRSRPKVFKVIVKVQ